MAGGGTKGKGGKASTAAKVANKKRKAPQSNQGNVHQKRVKAADKTPVKKGKPSAAKKVKKAAAASQVEEDDDVEIADEDIEFFESHDQFSSFLSTMDRNAISKSTKKTSSLNKPVREPKSLEEIESAPRAAPAEAKKSTIDISTKLPVKTFDGALQPNKLMEEIVEEAEEEGGDDDQEDDEDDEDGGDGSELGSGDEEMSDLEVEEITDFQEPSAPAKKPATISLDELKAMQARRLHAKKEELALLCESILESPEDAVKKSKEHPEQLSKFQQLHAMCEDTDVTLVKLAMLSELSVLLDVLPDYRIRIGSEAASSGPQKKRVKEMKEFESGMLNQYQTFLKFLSATATTNLSTLHPNQMTRTATQQIEFGVAETAVKCLAELLKVKYAFNFNLNLIHAMVPLADSPFVSIQRPVCDAFEVVFKTDKSGLAPLEIVKDMANYVKKRHHRVSERMIKTLLAMPLDVTMEAGEIARRVAKSSRKKRRRQQKEGDTIATGLKEAEAVVDKSERDKTQADILHELVLIYFRILKNSTYSPAMPAVLEGLTKFAYLINLEIMIDLMKVLKALLKEDILPLSAALQAILTGIKTLQGPGQELKVDEKDFVDHLYRLLLRFAQGENVACFNTALLCVEAVFIKRKEIVVDRVAAFIKRLLVVSMFLYPHQMLAVSALIRSLFHRYSKLHQLLETDQDRVASGMYRADVDDPDFCNPFASACWELSFLGKHYHPVVASFSTGTANLEPSLPNEHPKAMLERYDTVTSGEFVPKVPVPKPNPLHTKIQKQKKSKAVFVQQTFANPSPFLEDCLALDTTDHLTHDVNCFFVSVE
ncbi:hypothetical protein H310_09097 [Aphanomyces invadans]|uniref:Nucleolar complex protein 3 homolog n=1 Tax=Aphanomyces invadans TaxID=157072 RepID=A0A024TUR2_9STRA|nr:hypothetical protein H310_09097 [Aphanomyces invadans]ETV97724.1 hypothetical protein H310_09097 [Aphanomyces invadans]|eukprot:XP_008873285.1 hypothetical protein H310_09097 [Aphanomyces invadans]